MQVQSCELKIVDYGQIDEGERRREEYGDLNDLALSLQKEGIIQPLAVKDSGDDRYLLIAGGRRYRAAGIANITSIPVRIYPNDIDDLTFRSIELMENLNRKSLTWAEEVSLKKEIHELHIKIHGEKKSTAKDAPGWSAALTAQLTGVSQGALSDDIKLARAMELVPSLKSKKNKKEAMNALKGMEEALVKEALAKKIQDQVSMTSLEVTHKEMINRYIVDDFFEGIKKVPDGSIDIIELDPPYGIDLHSVKEGLQSGYYNGDEYNEVSSDRYIPFIEEVIKECNRVMSDNSWMICWFAIDPYFEEVYNIIKSNNMKVSRIVGMWSKGRGQTKSPQYNLANTYEPFFYARKGNPVIAKAGRGNVFNYKPVQSDKKVHPTERPIELIQEVLSTFGWQSASVLVPFLGSGNTILAASNIGMKAFGYDLSKEYKNSYISRVIAGAPGQYKSYRGDGDNGES